MTTAGYLKVKNSIWKPDQHPKLKGRKLLHTLLMHNSPEVEACQRHSYNKKDKHP